MRLLLLVSLVLLGTRWTGTNASFLDHLFGQDYDDYPPTTTEEPLTQDSHSSIHHQHNKDQKDLNQHKDSLPQTHTQHHHHPSSQTHQNHHHHNSQTHQHHHHNSQTHQHHHHPNSQTQIDVRRNKLAIHLAPDQKDDDDNVVIVDLEKKDKSLHTGHHQWSENGDTKYAHSLNRLIPLLIDHHHSENKEDAYHNHNYNPYHQQNDHNHNGPPIAVDPTMQDHHDSSNVSPVYPFVYNVMPIPQLALLVPEHNQAMSYGKVPYQPLLHAHSTVFHYGCPFPPLSPKYPTFPPLLPPPKCPFHPHIPEPSHHNHHHHIPPLPPLPSLPDTPKRPKCPMLYKSIGSRCIAIFSIAKMAWNDAKEFCDGIFGDMFTFDNLQEYNDMAIYLKEAGLSSSLWTGGKEHADGWRWVSGSYIPLGAPYWTIKSYLAAFPTEASPNTGKNAKHLRCAAMNFENSYFLSDAECSSPKTPVCVLRNDVQVVVAVSERNYYPALESSGCPNWMMNGDTNDTSEANEEGDTGARGKENKEESNDNCSKTHDEDSSEESNEDEKNDNDEREKGGKDTKKDEVEENKKDDEKSTTPPSTVGEEEEGSGSEGSGHGRGSFFDDEDMNEAGSGYFYPYSPR